MSGIFRPIRFAVRRLLRAPAFTAVAATTLSIGIGATTAIFSVVHGILLQPLPYERQETLVSVGHTSPGFNYDVTQVCDALYFTYRAENHTLEDLGIWRLNSYSLTGDFEPDQVGGVTLTEPVLRLLGVKAALGRIFTPTDDAPNASPTMVISWAYWQRRFGARPGAVGSSVILDGQSTQIIGVLPKDFAFLDVRADLYVPLRLDPAKAALLNFNYDGIGRLKPGITPQAAMADLAPLIPVAAARYANTGVSLEQLRSVGLKPAVKPLKLAVVGNVSSVLWVLLASVGLILLLACANVANLFLVQAEARQREMAVRTALGAGRRALIGDLLTESALLGIVAGGVGLLLAAFGLQVLRAIGPGNLPRLQEIRVDGTVIAFTLGIAVIASLACGLYPALRFGRQTLLPALRDGGRSAGSSRKQLRIKNGLVVVQVALALVLLVGSGLMVRTMQALRHVDPGFRHPERVVTFTVVAPPGEVPVERLGATYAAIFERLRAIPGVRSVAGVSDLPLPPDYGSHTPPRFEGEAPSRDAMTALRHYNFTYPGLEQTLEIPLVAGRSLTWADLNARAKVVMVSENLAKEKWGSAQAAVGHRLGDPGNAMGQDPHDWYEIVGVLGDVRYEGVDKRAPTIVYWPAELDNFLGEKIWAQRLVEFAIRLDGPAPAAFAKEIETAIWSVNGHIPIVQVSTLGATLEKSLARPAFAMLMLGIAAVVALVLGLVGIYAVVSFIVAERTREIGLRIALGAEPRRVRQMVIGQATAVAGVGIAIGVIAAGILTQGMRGILYGVTALDPFTYIGVALALALVAVAASWLPARRAARLDPIRALRQD